ncbi:MAG: patatin-like phospholipase family protein [Pseudomonadota bacterium]
MAKLSSAYRTTIPDITQRRVGLALGGGGARGLAHIAILEVFDELGIKPAVIAGTSIGAIFGAAYAAGYSAAKIRELTEDALGNRWTMIRQLLAARAAPRQHMLRLVPVRSALLNPEAVLDVVLPEDMPSTFDALNVPLSVTATNLTTHTTDTFASGPLKTAIAASMAIPVVFSPVERNDVLYLDGGLTNPCPFDLVMPNADITVAIDVSGATSETAIGANPTAMTIAVQTAQILQKAITRERLRHQRPDLYLDFDLDGFGAFEFYKAREIITAAEAVKPQFRAQLQRLLASADAE